MPDIFDFVEGTNRSDKELVFDFLKNRRSWMHTQEFSGSILGLPEADWNYIVSLIKGDRKLAHEVAWQLAKYSEGTTFRVGRISEEKMHRDYQKLELLKLKKVKMSCSVRAEPYLYPFEESFVYSWEQAGLQAANAFMYEAMCAVGSPRACWNVNIFEGWKKEDYRQLVFRNMLNLKMGSGENDVFQAIRVGLYFPSNFRPSIAKEIYNTYGMKKHTVLDFSSGFGGRFTGFWASDAIHYIGVDPNSALVEPYQKLMAWLKTNYPKIWKSYEFLPYPAEDVDYSGLKGEVGLVFTSPPYFDTEQYSKEETQSYKRYDNVIRWRKGFLKPVLQKMSDILVKGDYCIINICDSVSRNYKLCDYMCKFMEKELGFEVLPALKMLLAARPGVNMIKKRVAEPMWIFRRR